MNNQEFIIREQLRGFDLVFKITYDLFSYKKIDSGTRLLIETLETPPSAVCLDLGCGYGAVGIAMAKLNPNGKIFFVDRDLVAVGYTKTNCQANGVENFDVRLSNGFDNLKGVKFDVIAANLPTHIAKPALEKMIADTKDHLNNQGQFYVVCVSRLKPYIQRELQQTFTEVNMYSRNTNYSVLVAN